MIWMAFIALHMMTYIGLSSGFSFRYPNTLGLMFPLPLLHGVFLYFYTCSVTGTRSFSILNIIKHATPALVIVALAIPFYILPADQKIAVFQNDGKGFEWFIYIMLSMVVVLGISYSIISISLIRKHRKNLLKSFSNTDNKMLRWLEILSIGLGIIWVAVIFFDDSVIFGLVALFVFCIALAGINQVPVFYNHSNGIIVEANEITTSNPKVHNNGPDNSKDDKHLKMVFESLEKLMETEKIYREPDLTLAQLSSKLNHSPNIVSETINSVARKSFYQYINDFRVKEFIEIANLPKNQRFTFIALAYECGFKSKTTFYKYFKHTTGKTPTDFFDTTERPV